MLARSTERSGTLFLASPQQAEQSAFVPLGQRARTQPAELINISRTSDPKFSLTDERERRGEDGGKDGGLDLKWKMARAG